MFIAWPLNPNASGDDWSYFRFKCPRLHWCATAFSLLSVDSDKWDMGIPSS
jgi:hypothetical protein